MLNKYKEKRNFKETPEPEGKVEKAGSKLRFVIQKHEASQLHFDLRLENEGVMKSWAVPKGPSLNPKDRRLAMEVEDHPIEYNKFEGTIPEGNYGAGTVMIWDNGFFEPIMKDEGESDEDAVTRHLKDGHLKFRLFGKKLHGEFAIFKVKPNPKFGSKNKNAWLLIKHNDEFANKAIPHEDVSVVSGRTMDEIAEGRPKEKIKFEEIEIRDEEKSNGNDESAVSMSSGSDEPEKAKFPESISPMLASLADEPFNSTDWLYELKWDGYRALAQIRNGKVRLYSRNDQDFNDDYPEIVSELEKLPGNIVLDGEVVAVDEDGVSRFQLIQNKKKDKDQKVLYYVFDILYFDKFDLRGMSLEKRLEILKDVVKPNGVVRLSETFEDGLELFESAKHLGMEGIIAKRKDSTYREDRSSDWLKIKAVNEQEFVIGGYTEPKGQRKRFGSILVGEYVDGAFVYRGHVGTGFNSENMKELQELMDEYEVDESPFKDSTLVPSSNVEKWIKPKIVVQVKFSEWTGDQMLRHPVYLGVRKDKKAKEVIGVKIVDSSKVENEDSGNSSGKEDGTTLPDLEFSHLDKMYWPKEKYTKRDLLEYYNDIGDVMMPYLVDRPQNMNRHPNGINGESFYQKDYDNEHPDYVTTKKIYSSSTKKYVDYILCQNKETLLFLANLGCIEINPWNSKVDSIDNPDYVLFDLDPVEVDFKDVVKVANELNELCGELDIQSYCKTSGKRGLHIYLPLDAKYGFDDVKIFAELIAVKLQSRLPKIVSLERSPDDRKGKVYIDYIQNRKGQTTACAYSVRPTIGATVSTPLKWDEVNGRLDPNKFHIKNMRERLDAVGDLWEGVLGEGIDIVKVLKKLS